MSSREPTSADLLLQVALGDEGAAEDAWQRWCARFPFDDLDSSSFLVLPAAYARLVAQGVSTDLAPRLRGVVRHEWVADQVIGTALDAAVDALLGEDIRTLDVAGRARSRYFGETTARSLSDAGVLVRPADGAPALACLARHGWTPATASSKRQRRLRRTALSDDSGTTVDLHLAVLGPEHDGGDDERFWDRAAGRAFAPSDELLQTIVHGLYGLSPGARWRLDAAMIVRSGAVDWQTFAAEADRTGLLATAGAELRGLAEIADLDLPPVLAETGGWRETRSPFGRLWARYERQAGSRRRRPAVLGFASWLVANYDATEIVAGARRQLRRPR